MNDSTRRIEFIYFDLGNVLLSFDHHQASRQIAELFGASQDEVHNAVFTSGLELQYERGELSSEEFHGIICSQFGDCPLDLLMTTASDMFQPIAEVHLLVNELHSLGRRLGVLSNTCEAHWEFCGERYEVLDRFELYALSYELRSLKPEPKIYDAAARLAGVAAESIFFVDDREENVDAALRAGYDAVQFESPDKLRNDLVTRGLLVK